MEICLLTEIINGHVSCYIKLVSSQYYLKKIRQIEIQVFLDAAPCLQAMLGDPEEWSSNLHRDVSNSAATDTAKRP